MLWYVTFIQQKQVINENELKRMEDAMLRIN